MEEAMNQPTTSSNPSTNPSPVVSRQPTLRELQEWKNQGVRIDLPGSPSVGKDDSPDEYKLASQNTEAVADALSRLMSKANDLESAAETEEPMVEWNDATVEIDVAENEAIVEETTIDSGFSIEFVQQPEVSSSIQSLQQSLKEPQVSATQLPFKLKKLAHAKWEAETLVWPNEIDKILDQNTEQWQSLSELFQSTVKSLALVALGQGCGCTTITTCLAKLLAEQGKKVLVIDEGTGPSSFTSRIGLGEDLDAGGEPVESAYEAMVQLADQPIAVLPAGYRNYISLTANELSYLANDFDAILWDGEDNPDVWCQLLNVDRVLIVRDARGTHDAELKRMIPDLEASRINVVGIADNFWR